MRLGIVAPDGKYAEVSRAAVSVHGFIILRIKKNFELVSEVGFDKRVVAVTWIA